MEKKHTHTHNHKKKCIFMHFCVCVYVWVTTWFGMLLWLMSSRFSRWEWNKGQWTMEMPSLFSTMKPTVQSSGRRIVADVCSNWEPLQYTNTKTHTHINYCRFTFDKIQMTKDMLFLLLIDISQIVPFNYIIYLVVSGERFLKKNSKTAQLSS